MRKPYAVFIILFALTLFIGVGLGHAQTSRMYFAGYLGLNTYGDQEFDESTVPTSGDIDMKNAFSLAGALGVRLDRNWRVEGELSYRKADLNNIKFDGGGEFKMGGDLTTWLAMVNVYYDFDLSWQNFVPYLTAGIGLANHEVHVDDISGFAVDATDDTMGLAWQLGGGMKYRISPDVAFSGGYRYVGTSDLEVDSYDIEHSSHELRIGLEYDIPVRRSQ